MRLRVGDWRVLLTTTGHVIAVIRIALRGGRRLAEDEEELVPAAIVDRIFDGESRIRVWRERHGLRAAALAETAGLDTALVEDIETGKPDVTVETLLRLAAALIVLLDDLAG